MVRRIIIQVGICRLHGTGGRCIIRNTSHHVNGTVISAWAEVRLMTFVPTGVCDNVTSAAATGGASVNRNGAESVLLVLCNRTPEICSTNGVPINAVRKVLRCGQPGIRFGKNGLVELLLFDKRKEDRKDRHSVVADEQRRQSAKRVVKIVGGKPDLLQVVGTLGTPCGFTSGLNRRQEQRNQNADDCDDDKKLNEGEAGVWRHSRRPSFIYSAPPPPN